MASVTNPRMPPPSNDSMRYIVSFDRLINPLLSLVLPIHQETPSAVELVVVVNSARAQ